VDKELSCLVVSVYNLAQGRGPIIGDSVAIPEPYLTHIDAKYLNQVIFLSNLINKIKTYVDILLILFSDIPVPQHKSKSSFNHGCEQEKYKCRMCISTTIFIQTILVIISPHFWFSKSNYFMIFIIIKCYFISFI